MEVFMNIDTLEIVDGFAIKRLLEKTNLFKNSEVISLPFLLNVGNISNLENEKRYVCGHEIAFKKYVDGFVSKIKTVKNIRIWFSKLDCEDMCFYLFVNYLIQQFGNNNMVSFIDVSKLNKFAVSEFNENEIKDLFKIEEVLDSNAIDKNALYWENLVKENEDLRIYIDKKLMSTSYDYLDKIILNLIKEHNKISKWELEKLIIEDGMCGIYSSLVIDYRIDELIKDKKIIVNQTIEKIFESGYKIDDQILEIV